MNKMKEYITEEEQSLLKQLRSLTGGKLATEQVEQLMEFARTELLPVASYSRGNMSVEEWATEYCGGNSTGEEMGDEIASQSSLIILE